MYSLNPIFSLHSAYAPLWASGLEFEAKQTLLRPNPCAFLEPPASVLSESESEDDKNLYDSDVFDELPELWGFSSSRKGSFGTRVEFLAPTVRQMPVAPLPYRTELSLSDGLSLHPSAIYENLTVEKYQVPTSPPPPLILAPSPPSRSLAPALTRENLHLNLSPEVKTNRSLSVSSASSLSSSSSRASGPVNPELYKTELCATFMKSLGKNCPYGNKCQFAHGRLELVAVKRSNNYRSKPCVNWAKNNGYCPYGNRCCFKHGA